MKYTIVVTVYNKEDYIERCLNTVCNQSFDNYEVIVVNDGSTDGSENVIKKCKKKYKFRYISKENTGIADTRNFVLNKIKTDYFLFVDGDDYISTDLLRVVDSYSGYDVLSFLAVRLDSDLKFVKNMLKPVFSGSGEDFFKMLVSLKSEFTVPWGYVYRTDYFRNGDFIYPTGNILEDFYLTPFIIMSASLVISIDYIGYYYVFNDDGIMSFNNNDLITKTYLDYYDVLVSKIFSSSYSVGVKGEYLHFLADVLLWHGRNLSGTKRRLYVSSLRKKGVLKGVKNSGVKRCLINLGLYYKIVNILSR